MSDYLGDEKFISLAGAVVRAIEVNEQRDEVRFDLEDGRSFLMYHEQDCCESVFLEDVAGGELDDLVGQEILEARVDVNPEGAPEPEYVDESSTWTFYTIKTNKNTLVLRWLGQSNGYYSEAVTFTEVT